MSNKSDFRFPSDNTSDFHSNSITAESKLPTNVFNNYFSVGIYAHILNKRNNARNRSTHLW